MRYSYQVEKFNDARRNLMLPHPKGEDESIANAFHECNLALISFDESSLDHTAKKLLIELRGLMNTDGIEETEDGTWKEKARQFTDDEKYQLSHIIDELAFWFDHANE